MSDESTRDRVSGRLMESGEERTTDTWIDDLLTECDHLIEDGTDESRRIAGALREVLLAFTESAAFRVLTNMNRPNTTVGRDYVRAMQDYVRGIIVHAWAPS